MNKAISNGDYFSAVCRICAEGGMDCNGIVSYTHWHRHSFQWAGSSKFLSDMIHTVVSMNNFTSHKCNKMSYSSPLIASHVHTNAQ